MDKEIHCILYIYTILWPQQAPIFLYFVFVMKLIKLNLLKQYFNIGSNLCFTQACWKRLFSMQNIRVWPHKDIQVWKWLFTASLIGGGGGKKENFFCLSITSTILIVYFILFVQYCFQGHMFLGGSFIKKAVDSLFGDNNSPLTHFYVFTM